MLPRILISWNVRLTSYLILCSYKFMGVKPLPPSEALDKAVDFLSESIVVSFGTMIIVVEVFTAKWNAYHASKHVIVKYLVSIYDPSGKMQKKRHQQKSKKLKPKRFYYLGDYTCIPSVILYLFYPQKLNERFDEILQRCSSIQMQLDELEQVLPPMSEVSACCFCYSSFVYFTFGDNLSAN